jgi:pyruvate dehydrogenase E2 component (dihydrolipoamide acetyltransferase)
MSTEFILPDLGEGIHEAEIISILVKEGETIKEDQPLMEVETDKAMVEIPSPVSGKVEKVHVKVGQVAKVGMVMFTFSGAGGASASGASAEKVKAKGEEKAQPETSARTAQAAPAKTASISQPSGNGKHPQKPSDTPVPATPATRRLAREHGIDIKLVNGSGPAGRILKEDIESFVKGGGRSPIKSPFGAPQKPFGGGKDSGPAEPFEMQTFGGQPVDLPDFSKYGEVERIPLRSIRRKIAQNMMQSWSHIPHVTHFDEADVTQLNESIKKYEKQVKEAGGRLTLTVMILKAIVSGLRRYPQFNSSLDEKTGEIVLKHYYNVGIAVATDRGLIVPVIRNVEQKSIIELAVELGDIAKKTREGKIELDRLQGGTFTITNIGAIGGVGMVPMVNFPEAAILGMAKATPKPVVRDGVIQIRTIMPVALSFDHRIADGAEAAYFVRHVADCLEYPMQLLLEG